MSTPDPQLQQTVAENIRRLMTERKINQHQLAAMTNGLVAQKTISNILRGKDLQLKSLQAIAQALQIEPWLLLMPPGDDTLRLISMVQQADSAGRELVEQILQRDAAFRQQGQ